MEMTQVRVAVAVAGGTHTMGSGNHLESPPRSCDQAVVFCLQLEYEKRHVYP